MKVTVAVEIGGRTVIESLVTAEDFRGDYRTAVTECATRIELATYGPHSDPDGNSFDTQLQMRPRP